DPGLLIYLDEDEMLLPLSVFTELLEFPISVNTSTGNANGWFLNEDNKFELSPPYKSVKIGEKTIPITKGIVETHIDDIYVSSDLLEEWFPITLTMNFNELRLYMDVSEDLPIEARAKRRNAWEKSKLHTKPFVEIEGDVITLPYRKFAAPTVQVNHNVGFSRIQKVPSASSSHSVNLQGDLLGMGAQGSFNFSTDNEGKNEFQNIQFRLKKEDYEGGIAGPMKATSLEIGDISTGSFPLAAGQSRGRGFNINNNPINFIRDPNEFKVEGDAPIGWDIEVYQDQNLLDFATIDTSGKYAFDTIPLREGFNLFRIVLYGPNGEKRERFERFYLGPGMVEPGKLLYEISGLQSSTPLLNFSTQNQPDTDPTLSVIGEYGLHKNFSVNAGYYNGPLGKGSLDAVGVGARISTTNMFTQVDLLRDKSGAQSYSVNATGNLSKNITLRGLHRRHKGYAQDLRSTEETTSVSLSQQFSLKLIPIGSYSLEAKRETFDSGSVTDTLVNRISGTLLGLNLNNRLEHTIRNSDRDNATTTGDLTLRRRLKHGTVRGRFAYDLTNSFTAESLELQLQHPLSRHLFLNTALNTSFIGDKETKLSAALDMKTDKMSFGFNTSASTKGDTRFGMKVAYNLIPRSLYGDYEVNSDSGSLSLGQLVVQPFLDKNQNGIMDGDEEGLEDVLFKNTLRGTKAKTNANGQAVITGMSPNVVNKIIIDGKTLPDIYMAPAQEVTNILGKRGINGPIMFPIHQLGEISGTLSAKTDDGEVSVENVRMVLLDENEEVVAETFSEFDGFYLFPSLKMGIYEIYFPYSDELRSHYNGESSGPQVVLTIENSEQSYADILIEDNDIQFKKE
ncbi:MAG: hypothetical protein KUG81_01640, partial [Gammaproteobacteria bacterium]|nr:hypothetical protein [Gammaproteobacteria bacterium]